MLLTVALSATIVRTAPAEETAKGSLSVRTIHITSSTYGGLLPGTTCDTSALVKQQCEGRTICTILVDNTLCRTAPELDVVLIRALSVSYHCGYDSKKTQHRAEAPGKLRLSCVTRN